MRIGYDAKRLYNNFTGLGNYSRTLVSNLLRFHPEHNYYLYTPKVSSKSPALQFAENPALKTFKAVTPFKSLWRSYSIVNQLKKDKVQLYHGLSGEIPFNLSRRQVRSVVTMHDLIFRIYPETYKPVDRFLYDRKFRYACRHADSIVAISESTKTDIIKYYAIESDKIEVIYQACNPIFYDGPDKSMMKEVVEKYNLPGDFLLYVGSVIPRKNLVTVIKALQILPDDLRIPLVIVGSGSGYKNEVKRLIAEKKIEKSVIWIEDLYDSRQLKALYNLTQLFIYPSVYEGFGIPVTEALLSGAPVLTSNVSSLPEAGGPHSFCINPLDEEEMADGIENILTDCSLKAKMVSEGYRYASEKFSAIATTQKMFSLYEQLIVG